MLSKFRSRIVCGRFSKLLGFDYGGYAKYGRYGFCGGVGDRIIEAVSGENNVNINSHNYNTINT